MEKCQKKCPKIVCIEDDDAIRESLKYALEMEGYNVATFRNGKEAFDDLKDCEEACLILLDLMMPVMNGWQFLEARKNKGDTIAAVPVFIVSAFSDPQKVKGAGATGYIKKPVDLDVLLLIVKKYCDTMEKYVGADDEARADAKARAEAKMLKPISKQIFKSSA